MFDKKYGKVLTVILIIVVIAILALLGFLLYDNIKGDKIKKDAESAIEEFNKNNGITADATPDVVESPDVDDNEIPDIVETSPTPSTSTGTGSSSNKNKYGGFVMLGYIEIPRNNVNVPILEKATPKSLEIAVATIYPAHAQLNEPGNVVIAGHNYRTQLFFSNNKRLEKGDKIYITDESGRKLTYEVYDKFEATPEDTSFYTRDTQGVPEITLTTCTEDVSKRTIILARAK